MKKVLQKAIRVIPLFTLLTPSASRAEILEEDIIKPNSSYFQSLLSQAQDLVAQLVPLVIGIGLLLFIWGLAKFILASGDVEQIAVGKRRMVWGILTLFVIVSIWGLVLLLQQIVGINPAATMVVPSVY